MPIASPRYAFTATMVSGAPPDPGVFALWEGDELIYYGRAHNIQSQLLAHQLAHHASGDACTARATHYGWEISGNPPMREADLLREYQHAHGRLPRCNAGMA